jgi:hypothetical protein
MSVTDAGMTEHGVPTQPGLVDADELDGTSTTSRGPAGRAETLATMVLLLVPVAMYIGFIHEYGVNAIWYDQWDNVALLTHSTFYFHSYVGHTDLSMLWAQHNENRMLFPNFIVLALGALTHFNIVTELYLSAVILVIAFSLIVFGHWRDLGIRHPILYVPLGFLVFSFGQYGDTLFGFQVAWYLIFLALAVVIFLLNTFRVEWIVLSAAIATAIVGSYSSIEGLLIWPVGIVLLLWRHGKRSHFVAWIVAAIATGAIYFYNFDFSTSSGGGGYLKAHPIAVLEFFFFNIGDIAGAPLRAGASNPDVLTLGVLIFLLALVCLVVYARPGHLSKSPVGPALIIFGLLFAATVAYGRSSEGLFVASQSRYATFNLLILGGCYLCVLEGWPSRELETDVLGVGQGAARMRENVLSFVDRPRQTLRKEWKQFVVTGLRVLAVLLVVIMVEGGVKNGRSGGSGARVQQQLAAVVAAHARVAPNSLIKAALFPNPTFAYANIRRLAELASADHLSLFGTGALVQASRASLPRTVYTPPQTAIFSPEAGQVLRGSVFVVATAKEDYPITAVEFQISTVAGQSRERFRMVPFRYGYLGAWPTTDVPNGYYTIKSIVQDVSGKVGMSRSRLVTVDN